jgi:hypothetical protein
MASEIAPLLPSDEGLNHQIVQTFGAVLHPDLSWTEKIWTTIARKDGSLQVDFGLGKYLNRGVMDAFGGVSRGKQQWTVRGSRELGQDPETAAVGPLRYELVRPLEAVRFVLEKNDIQPVSFDITFEHALPPFFEDRHLQRDSSGFRVVADVLRYHQAGRVSGWIRVGGEEHAVREEEWFAFRDHSWGIRPGVGLPPADIRANPFGPESRFLLNWCPMVLTGADGALYEIQYYYMAAGDVPFYVSGHVNHADGSQDPILRIQQELSYDKATRMLLGGEVHLDTYSGQRRTVVVEPVGESGFHLGTGLYFGFDGHYHGMWRGPMHLDGEYFADCQQHDVLPRIHQLRDRPIRVSEGNAHGFGIMESVVVGTWPRLGLTAGTSFV